VITFVKDVDVMALNVYGIMQTGNAKELGDASGSPGKSSHFFLTVGVP
jgi:hypothetical protein